MKVYLQIHMWKAEATCKQTEAATVVLLMNADELVDYQINLKDIYSMK